MKTLRLCILLLLAVLLPVRGALAVGMHCPGAAAQPWGQAQQSGHSHDHHAAGSGHAYHEAAASHGHAHDTAHDPDGASDKCNLCSASCSVTGMVSGSLVVVDPQPVSAVFPHLHAPSPSFVSGGQERPPRTP